MDIFFLQLLVLEFDPILRGHRLGKVHQLGATDLLIDFQLRDGRWLHISTDPLRLACYLTSRSPRQFAATPRSDTSFVALLQKHLEATRLESVESLGYDRVIKFHFAGEDGGSSRRVMVVALTGRTANLFLLRGTEIIAELREREEFSEEYRDPAPPGEKFDPHSCPRETWEELIQAHGGEVAQAAQKWLLGFSAPLARELAARVKAGASPADALRDILDDLSAPSPSLYANPPIAELKLQPGRDEFALHLSSIPLSHLAQLSSIHPATLNEAAEIYYSFLEDRRRFTTLKQKLLGLLNARLKKLASLLTNLSREEEKYRPIDTWQRHGELLLANLHQAVKTDDKFLVVDFYDAEQNLIEIDAAEKGSPKDAAEHYFKLARKGRHALESIASRRPPAEKEMASLQADRDLTSIVSTYESLIPLAEKYGLIEENRQPGRPAAPPVKKPKEESLPGVRRYRSSDGYEILVGRTDRDNDHLTMRIAKSFDLWFHAADYPGSHVVLRNPRRQPVPQRSITEAAQLAAKFSQAKDAPKVAVNYCEKKFVTKPKGFASGQVRLSSFRTIMVEPAEAGERIL